MMNRILFFAFLLFIKGGFSQNEPSIRFTDVPVWGSSGLLKGTVSNVSIAEFAIVVYINVGEGGGWWTKPYLSDPITQIKPDSSFATNIVIGGLDEAATQIIAFLIPLSYTPPVLSGGDLPPGLFAYPNAVACRPHGARSVYWSGYEWIVKKSVGSSPIAIGPGPNIFNDHDSMVWVDNLQRLHLRIAKKGNVWHCTELICKASLGYNRYLFNIVTRLDLLDENIVTGLFTWDDCALLTNPVDQSYREIDIEFSRWGNPEEKNSQFVIQPWTVPGNIDRFHMNLTGIDHSVHLINWQADSIQFVSRWGTSSHSWTYKNKSGIPEPALENIRINFWLMNGTPPSDMLNSELILSSFITGIDEQKSESAELSAFPNPMENKCQFIMNSDHPDCVVVEIMSIQGIVIRELYHGNVKTGETKFEWDGKDENQIFVSSGIYLIGYVSRSEVKYLKIIKI